ncbi:MAG: glycoside hydrolase family 38 C-terminal domain-containing protein [Nitrososphaeria archaeon]
MVKNEKNSENFVLRFSSELKFSKNLLEIYPEYSEEWTNLLKNAEISLQRFLNHEISLDGIESAESSLEPIAKFAKEFTIHYIGHAHIDMNWLWPWNETVDVCYRTFTTVGNLMDEYPEFKFSQSQASVYKAMEDYSLETFEMIREKVKNGQWEITANTWVEGDKNLASGEALVRQILYTKKYFKDKFDIPYDAIKIDWEPDTFGHAWTYPQILKKAGIKRYYFCRAGKGYRLFWWQSPDGSKVLAWNDEKLWYLGHVKPDDIFESLEHYKETGMKDYMIVYGVGDHGGGPTRHDIEMILEMQSWPIFPKIKFSTTDEFFSIAEKFGDKLPVVNDELNFTFRGCYTSQSEMKKINRYAENDLVKSESYATLSKILVDNIYPYDQLYKGWINTLFNQFHDILPGSGIHATYEYSKGLFQDTKARLDIVKDKSLKAITERMNTEMNYDLAISVFNPLSWKLTCPVSIKIYEDFGPMASLKSFLETANIHFEVKDVGNILSNFGIYTEFNDVHFSLADKDNNEMPVQYEFGGEYGFNYLLLKFTATNVPAFGYKTYYLKIKNTNKNSKRSVICSDGLNNKVVENEFLKLTIQSGSGNIISLIDKRNGKEYVAEGKQLALLQVLKEDPHTSDAWRIGQILSMINLDTIESAKIVENGPAKVTVRTKKKYNNSEIVMDISLYDKVPAVYFKLDVNWMEVGNDKNGVDLLKMLFPLNAKNTLVKCDIPFGSISRKETPSVLSLSNSPNNNSSLETTGIGVDVPTQKWLDIYSEDDDIGLCIVNNGKYGFDKVDNTVGMSLIRSTYKPDSIPEVGHHLIELAVYPHDKNWKDSTSARCGYEFNEKADAVYFKPHGGTIKDDFELLNIESSNIIMTGIKKAEDDDNTFIFRAYETNGIKETAVIKFNLSVDRVQETDLIEKPLNEIKFVDDTIKIDFAPYEIKTLKVKFT